MPPKDITRQLSEIQFNFSSETAEKKMALIKESEPTRFTESTEIIALHDRLLCLLAYPENKKVFEAAEKALQLLSKKTETFLLTANDSEVWKITESAIAHSTIRASFSYELLKWLTENYSPEISFSSCEAPKEIVGSVFKQILPPAVGEALFDNHEHTLESLVKKASGNAKHPDILQWTLTQFTASSISDKSKEQLFEQLVIYINWKTNPSSPTRSFARSDAGQKYFFQSSKLIRHVDIKKIFANKKIQQIPLSASQKKNLCDIAKGVLCSNYREIDPITYAENSDTELFDVGRGITIALYFMRPPFRLSCESYVSYMAFRNGVPMSYGGGWLFFDRTKMAANIFPPFRGGESALLFAHLYRLYHLRFGVNCFQVDPYQIGQKNHDAINSGAFWFYHRFGFLPNNEQLQQLADEELTKRNADKTYRTSSAVLRKFANTEMVLNLLPKIHAAHQDVLQKMQTIVTEEYHGNFTAYFVACFFELQKCCRQKKINVPKHLQGNALAMELCGFVSVFSNYLEFNQKDLKKFVAAMEEKSFGSERKFFELFNGIEKLRKDIYRFPVTEK
jgi:hypothetical protein